MLMKNFLPKDKKQSTLIGRVWRPEFNGPSVIKIEADRVIDITSKKAPTIRDIIEIKNSASYVKHANGEDIGKVSELLSFDYSNDTNLEKLHFLAPCDLQSIKACGVTFVESMLERVIEEKARGNPLKAKDIRSICQKIIGDKISKIVPGSKEAQKIKDFLIEENMWSQYLEVGIGPYAEIFTKSQPLSSVGFGSKIGLPHISKWNNPEPEIVLAIDSKGNIKGATLGNDFNLRDIEGRSALLLGKAKDNNASCSIGPLIRLLDENYTIKNIKNSEINLKVIGKDGFILSGKSSMSKISRDPINLVRQTIGLHHQYPDGLMLFLGTMFAPIKDRGTKGNGFTHSIGDNVEISCKELGRLINTIDEIKNCNKWTFGLASLMKNLSERNLI
mgnify:FL=1